MLIETQNAGQCHPKSEMEPITALRLKQGGSHTRVLQMETGSRRGGDRAKVTRAVSEVIFSLTAEITGCA